MTTDASSTSAEVNASNPYAASTTSVHHVAARKRIGVTALAVTLAVQTACVLAAIGMQSYGRTFPDPYFNAYSNVAAWLFISSFVLWIAGSIACANRVMRAGGLPVFAGVWLGISGLYFGWVLFNFVGFMTTGL